MKIVQRFIRRCFKDANSNQGSNLPDLRHFWSAQTSKRKLPSSQVFLQECGAGRSLSYPPDPSAGVTLKDEGWRLILRCKDYICACNLKRWKLRHPHRLLRSSRDLEEDANRRLLQICCTGADLLGHECCLRGGFKVKFRESKWPKEEESHHRLRKNFTSCCCYRLNSRIK